MTPGLEFVGLAGTIKLMMLAYILLSICLLTTWFFVKDSHSILPNHSTLFNVLFYSFLSYSFFLTAFFVVLSLRQDSAISIFLILINAVCMLTGLFLKDHCKIGSWLLQIQGIAGIVLVSYVILSFFR